MSNPGATHYDEQEAAAAAEGMDMGQVGKALALLALFEAGQAWFADKGNREAQDKMIDAFSAFIRTY